MDLEITQNNENALFGRKDVKFLIRHTGETTPTRVQVRQLVATEIGTKTENVVIDHMESATGFAATRGVARAYQSADLARKSERVHFLKRNNLFQEKKEGDE
ncbi:MAG: 30S ribosomal protein S24e [Thermoplasmatota archaeon]